MNFLNFLSKRATIKPAKLPTNLPQPTHKLAINTQLQAESQFFMLPKTSATMQNMFAKHFMPLHQRFRSEDQNQVRIEGGYLKGSLKNKHF